MEQKGFAELGIIDTQCHLWHLEQLQKAWQPPDAIARTFVAKDLHDACIPTGVRQCVLIEAGTAPEDNQALEQFAASSALIAGMVAYVDLQSPDLDEQLAYWVSEPDEGQSWAINRALQGIAGPTIVHLCFGYAAMVRNKPAGYAFLPQLAESIAEQISIEAAQPRLDLGVLKELSGKTILLGVLDLDDAAVETTETVAARLREGLRHIPAERLVAAPDCGMKYLPRERAFGKLRALADGAALVRRELAG